LLLFNYTHLASLAVSGESTWGIFHRYR